MLLVMRLSNSIPVYVHVSRIVLSEKAKREDPAHGLPRDRLFSTNIQRYSQGPSEEHIAVMHTTHCPPKVF